MLTEQEQEAIDAHVAEYPTPRGACVDALKVVQRHRGWVSDEAVADVAGYLEMTPQEVDSLATFYSLIYRQPVGEHVILLCDSVSCWLTGYDEIRQTLRDELGIELGQTSADGQFTVLPMACLGDCDHSPVMMVDEETHHDLTPEAIAPILAGYGRAGGGE